MEEWYSMTTLTVSNPSIYITETISKITVAVQEFAISGYDTNSPFDLSTGSPTNATGTSDTMSTSISPRGPQDMLLGFAYGGGGMISAGTGFSGICLNLGPCVFQGIDADASEFEIVTTTQSSALVSMTQTGGASWGLIVDSVRSISPSLTSVSPSRGIVGTGITITGTSFTGALALSFCTTLQPGFTVVNDTLITTTAPQVTSPPDSQTCNIVVTKSGGSSSLIPAGRFSFLPSVKSVSPETGSNGTDASVTGTSFVGSTTVTVCGVPQSKFTVANDTEIRLTVLGLTASTSQHCDVVVTNSVGKSSSSSGDVFTYAPQSGSSGATNHVPNTSINSNKILYITFASIAAVLLASVAVLMRRWDPEKRDRRLSP